MVLPAIGAALSFGYGLLPGAIGSLLPGVIDAIAGAKTEEEARRLVGPQREAMVARLIGGGTPRAAAEAQADEAIQGEVQKKMQEGALPGWATAALSLAGGIGGAALGAKAGKLLKGTAAKQADEGAAAITKTEPGTNLGKLAVDPPPTAKLEPGLLRPFSPTAQQRGIGAKPDGLIDEAEMALAARAPLPEARGIPALSRAKPMPPEADELMPPFAPRKQMAWDDVESEVARRAAQREAEMAEMMNLRGSVY